MEYKSYFNKKEDIAEILNLYDIVELDFLNFAKIILGKEFLKNEILNKIILGILKECIYSSGFYNLSIENNERYLLWKYDKDKVYKIEIGVIIDNNKIWIIKDEL